MKLYQKIMLSISCALLLCGALCIYLIGSRFHSRQLSQITDLGANVLQNKERFLQEICELTKTSESISRKNLEITFQNPLFEDCLLLDGTEIISDRLNDYRLAPEKFLPKIENNENSFRDVVSLGGRDILVLARKTDWISENAWLISLRDVTEIHTATMDFIRMFLVFWLLFLIVFLLLTAIFLRLLLNPLNHLKAAAGAVSEGKYDVPLDTNRADELGDISRAFVHMEENILAREQHLIQTSEAQKELIGSLSHEIRSPMTAVRGYTDMLLHVPVSDATREDALLTIYEHTGYLQRLSAKMMELSGLYQNDSITSSPVSSETLLQKSLALARGKWPNCSFSLFEASIFEISGDEDLLISLLHNLLDNAAKASPEGGEVLITARNGQITIRDHGKGIPQEALPQIFEPFYKTDRSRTGHSGLGLGLAIAKRIADLHGIILTAANAVDGGCEICLQFFTTP